MLISAALFVQHLGWQAGVAFALLLLGLSLVPVGGFRIGSWAMGVLGPASAAGLTLLAVLIITTLVPETLAHGLEPDHLAIAVLALATPLNALALGIARFDLYRLGYRPRLLPVLAAVGGGVASGFGQHAIAFWLAIGIVMMMFRLHAGRNRFDALIDMGAAIAALLVLVV